MGVLGFRGSWRGQDVIMGGPKGIQRRHKGDSRRPKGTQGDPRTTQGDTRADPRGPKGTQGEPKGHQRGTQGNPMGPKGDPRGAKWGPRGQAVMMVQNIWFLSVKVVRPTVAPRGNINLERPRAGSSIGVRQNEGRHSEDYLANVHQPYYQDRQNPYSTSCLGKHKRQQTEF